MESFIENLSKLDDNDRVVAFKAQQAIRFACNKLADPAQASHRAEAAKALAAELNAVVEAEPKRKKDKDKKPETRPRYSVKVRNEVLRALATVGGPAEVPEIVKALDALELREMARYALDRIPGDAAAEALAAALDDSGPEFRVGIVGSLARKGGSKALEALRKAIDDADPDVRFAAVDALAASGDAVSDAILVKAGDCGCPKARVRAAKARLRLAEKLRDSGDRAAAMRIYRSIPADAPVQRKAADLAMKSLR